MNKFNYRSIAFIFLIMFPMLWVIAFSGMSEYKLLIPLVSVLFILNIIAYRDVQIVTIIIIYIGIYFFYLFPFFYKGIQLSQYSLYNNKENFQKVILMFYAFFTGLLFSVKGKINPEKKSLSESYVIKNSYITKFVLFILIFLLFLLSRRQGINIYLANNYYEAYRYNLNVMGGYTLYAIIPIYILGVSYKNKIKRLIIVSICSLLFCGYALTRGTRMVIVPYFFLIFILSFDRKFSNWFVLFLITIGFFLLLIMNLHKANIPIRIENLLTLGNDEYIISHHADMDYIMCSIFGLLDDHQISTELRTTTNLGLFLETFIPPRFLPSEWKYPHAIAGLLPNGGGCFFFVVLYISFFSYIGIFCFGCLFGGQIKKLFEVKSKKSLYVVFIIMTLIFSVRWLSYDFHVLLRLPFYTILVLFIMASKYKGE